MPDEKDEYRTCTGAILTSFTFSVVMIYAIVKLQILFGYEDYQVLKSENRFFFSDTDMFNHHDGFAVAAAISSGTASEP